MKFYITFNHFKVLIKNVLIQHILTTDYFHSYGEDETEQKK